MNILLVCQYFAPEPFRVLAFCEKLQSQGHQVTILTGMPNYPEGRFYKGYGIFGPLKEICQTGIVVFRAPIIPRGTGGKIQLALNYLSYAISASFRCCFILQRKFDMVFVYQLSPITMALPAVFIVKLKRIPLVIYSLDLWPDSVAATGVSLPPSLHRIITKLSQYIYMQASRLLVSSQGFISRMIEMGISKEKLYYWPQSIQDCDVVSRNKCGNRIRRTVPEGFVIMFAGNIGVAQGFDTILIAAEKLRDLPDLHWVILGDGRMRGRVEDDVQARGLKKIFHFFGRYPEWEMPYWYSMADAMLVSLKKDPVFALTLPAKVQSYLACGRPILAALDGEGAKVVCEANAGFACASGDPDGLVAIVRKMISLPKAEREALGRNGVAYAEKHFSQKKLMQELDMIFSSVIREELTEKVE